MFVSIELSGGIAVSCPVWSVELFFIVRRRGKPAAGCGQHPVGPLRLFCCHGRYNLVFIAQPGRPPWTPTWDTPYVASTNTGWYTPNLQYSSGIVYSVLLLFTTGWGLPDSPHPFQQPTRSPLFTSLAPAGIWQQSCPASSGATIYAIATPDETRCLQLAYTAPSIQHRWGLLPVFSHVCVRPGINFGGLPSFGSHLPSGGAHMDTDQGLHPCRHQGAFWPPDACAMVAC